MDPRGAPISPPIKAIEVKNWSKLLLKVQYGFWDSAPLASKAAYYLAISGKNNSRNGGIADTPPVIPVYTGTVF